MPFLSLPADVLLEIFSYMDTASPLSATSADSSTSTLATMSLVCKHLCALARRPLLRSLRWCDKTKTRLNLNQWQRKSLFTNSLHVPKKLVMAVEFDFEAQSFEERSLDIILHERVYTRISSFSSLSALVFSNTSISAQYLYPVLLSLPMLQSLALLNVNFSQLTHNNETDDTLSAVLKNYPFTSLHLTHLALRGIVMSAEMENTYEYHPINFLRAPSLQHVEIMWTPQFSVAYARHVHSKTGLRRQSGAIGWPNTNIPCTVLESNTATEVQQQLSQISDQHIPLPLQHLTRLTVYAPMFDLGVIRALKMFLADCARHPSFDPPLHPWMTLAPASSLASPISTTQNTLLMTLLVEKCRLADHLDPTFQGCLAPVVRYEGLLWKDILSLFMGPSLPLTSTNALTCVSSFHSPSPTEAEDREIHMPVFHEVLHGLRALKSMFPASTTTLTTTTTTTTTPTTAIPDHRTSEGVRTLEIRVQALDYELLYAIQQMFGSSIEKVVIQYSHHNGASANTLLERIPHILSGLPRLRSFLLLRIPDPSIVFARTALERHAAIVGDQQWFRLAGHHHQPMVNPLHINNFMNPFQPNANHPHWNAPQVHTPEHLLTLDQFKQHSATMDRARRLAAAPGPSLFGFARRAEDGAAGAGDSDPNDDQEMRDHVFGWGRICDSLWEVQVENYRFVRRFGEIGERWVCVSV